MTNEPETLTPEDEIEALLPFYATGRLTGPERARVEAALAADPLLQASLALVEEDRDATLALNEALGAPSAAARDALFARIVADGRNPARPGLLDRAASWLASLSPRSLAWSAAAAALLIVLQGGMLADAWLSRESTYRTASGPGSQASAPGAYVLVAFVPEASADQIVRALQESRAVIVDGPRPGGLFRVRIADRPLTEEESDRALAALRVRSGVVRTAVRTN